MARTAQTNIKLRNTGTPLGSGGFTTLDLLGNISAVDAGNGIASVTGSTSAGGNISTEVLTATQSGSDITLDLTTLAHTFVTIEVVFRNGQATTPTTSWTRSGNTITVFNADSTEVFQIQYSW